MKAKEETRKIQKENAEIVYRFFKALYTLIDQEKIKGKQTFTKLYGINRWNLNTLEKQPDRGIFQPIWLTYLVRDFGVSADYLITGEGKVFK